MREVFLILFGAAFTGTTCWACGSLILRHLQLPFDRLEELVFSFLAGAAALSWLVLGLCLSRAAYPQVFLGIGSGAIALACVRRRRSVRGKSRAELGRWWKWVLFLVFTSYFLIYFVNALAPEVSPDGAGYHLGNVARDLSQNGFVWNDRNMYAAFPQGMEMLFLFAFAFGRHSSAALVHFTFFLCLPLLVLCYGRRFALPRAGGFAAVLLVTSPLFGVVGASAYNDVALVTLTFAVFYLLEVWDEIKNYKLLFLCGLFAGMCFALKYTGGLVFLFAVVWCLASPEMRRRPKAWAAFALPAAGMAVPWMLRDWFWLGNPLAPFFNRWFPNPFFSLAMERDYLSSLALFDGLRHWWEFPLEMTLYGRNIPGFLGPVFLLAPLALLSLRYARGWRLLAAGLLFSTPIAFNADTRFLMPGTPFLALALGMALEASSAWVLPGLALFEALLCSPVVTPLYSASWAWRIREIPWSAALRIEPEAAYIGRHFSDYKMQPALEASVPKAQIIFSFRTRPEAYFDRTILVGYESVAGNEIQQLLLRAAEHPELRPQTMAELKRRGVGFLMVSRGDPDAGQFQQHLSSWPLTLLQAIDETALYRIE